MKIVIGHIGSDAGWKVLDTDTGVVTVYPGNRDNFDEVRHSLQILKTAVEMKDTDQRKDLLRAAGEVAAKRTEILAPNGNIIAIF
jgi:hypothetical protein